eukprot:CAMPEP_0169403212 /NCGR_PEP_ID=MMETSP1017-20121227/55615_1 /TAXON_ID=342587 /ORGANISM="Karlodinium micrum, Strain CCMP2283" /LENGTH=71 /DNA_ID=CAMNT_0009509371 /DNA_START=59 /DNA_END=274 /DNA_ORIENTATION=-
MPLAQPALNIFLRSSTTYPKSNLYTTIPKSFQQPVERGAPTPKRIIAADYANKDTSPDDEEKSFSMTPRSR